MNTYMIPVIGLLLTFLVIWLVLLHEENRLLRMIHKKLSFMNPGMPTRLLTLSASNPVISGSIIALLESITGHVGIGHGMQDYRYMERLMILYTKEEGVGLSTGTGKGSDKVRRLKNVNRILDRIVAKTAKLGSI